MPSKADEVRRLLALGELSKIKIAEEVGCSRPYVFRLARQRHTSNLKEVMDEVRLLRADMQELRAMVRRLLGEPEDIISIRLKALEG
jgi:AraC-like DNA-binding protein